MRQKTFDTTHIRIYKKDIKEMDKIAAKIAILTGVHYFRVQLITRAIRVLKKELGIK